MSPRHGAPDPERDQHSDPYTESSETAASTDESDGSRRRRRRPQRSSGRRSRWQRALIIVLISGLVLGACGIGVFLYFTDRYLGNIDRIADPFSALEESERPAPATPVQPDTDPPLTFLLVGSDARDGLAGDRSDVIMLMRITGDRQRVQIISIPRDSWVVIPGRGLNKINAAYAFGGAPLLIQTVESITANRIDHFAVVDFAGFEEVTDALGGVDVQVAETTTSRGVTFTQGLNHLNGEQALIYVRQRYGLPGGDLDRVQRQQSYLRAMLSAVFAQNLLSDLGQTDTLLLALTSAISVDETLSNTDLLGLAYSLRGLSRASLNFLTVPVAGLGTEGAASVVYLDTARGAPMWSYLQQDNLAEHLTEFAPDLLPETPY